MRKKRTRAPVSGPSTQSFKGLRICLLTTQALDSPTFPQPDDDDPCDPRPFMPEADWTLVQLDGKEPDDRVVAVKALIDSARFDLFFNLCDGAADQPEVPGIEVVQTLEKLHVPFAGGVSAW